MAMQPRKKKQKQGTKKKKKEERRGEGGESCVVQHSVNMEETNRK